MKNSYGPLALPSGKQVTFRAPLGADQNHVMQMTEMTAERAFSDAILVDGYVAAKCVTEVNGTPTDGDYKRLFNEWEQRDIMFYQTVFNEMFSLNSEGRSKAKEAAAFLLKGQTSIAGSN